MEAVQDHLQTTRADENVSSVRQHRRQTESVEEEEWEHGSEEGGQLDPIHSGEDNKQQTQTLNSIPL